MQRCHLAALWGVLVEFFAVGLQCNFDSLCKPKKFKENCKDFAISKIRNVLKCNPVLTTKYQKG